MATAQSILNAQKREQKRFAPSQSIMGDFHLPNDSQVRGADGKLISRTLTDGSVLFADNMKIAQDNSNFFWDSVNKRLGIGTSSPTQKLSIRDDTANAYIDFNRSGTVHSVIGMNTVNEMIIQANTIPMRFSADGFSNTHMQITTSGDIGISTDSPDVKFHIKKTDDTAEARVESTAVNSNPSLSIKNDARTYTIKTSGNQDDKFVIRDITAGADRLAIDPSGNVGIGIAAAQQKLHVKGGEILVENAGVGRIVLKDTTASETTELAQAGSDGDFTISRLGTGGTDFGIQADGDMYLGMFGDVGIGTTSPGELLHVKSATGSNGVVRIDTTDVNDATSDAVLEFYEGGGFRGRIYLDGDDVNKLKFDTDGTDRMTIDIAGNVGIGTTSPGELLHVKGGEILVENAGVGRIVLKDTTASETTELAQAGSDGDFTISRLGTGGTDFGIQADGDMYLGMFGDVGIGTTTPTIKHSVNEKTGMTALGGTAIKLTNKTGANSVAGKLVKADTATNDAVILTAIGDVECFGVFLDDGISDGSEAWVVVGGIADVMFDDNVAAVRGNWVATGAGAGTARTSASPAASPQHFEEIGHCIESVAAGGGGTFIKARCVLHFN